MYNVYIKCIGRYATSSLNILQNSRTWHTYTYTYIHLGNYNNNNQHVYVTKKMIISCCKGIHINQIYKYATQSNLQTHTINNNIIVTCVSDKLSAWASALRSAPTTYWLLSNACSNFSSCDGENAVRTRFGFRNGWSRKSGRKKRQNILDRSQNTLYFYKTSLRYEA